MTPKKMSELNDLMFLLEDVDYKKYPILLVDDDPAVLETMVSLFEDRFNIEGANSADEALELLKNRDYAICISDQRMPNVNGAEFLSLAKMISPETVRVLITGYTDLESAIDAINECEIFRFIKKNTPTDEKEERIKEAIHHYIVHSEL